MSINKTHARCWSGLKRELPPSGPLPATLQTAGVAGLPTSISSTRIVGDRFTVYPLHMPPLVFLSDPQDIRAVLTAPRPTCIRAPAPRSSHR